MNYKTLGENIRIYRKKRNITQEMLAEKCEITPVFVSQIENAMRKPSLETVCSISEALCVSIDSLINKNANERDLSDILNLLKNRTNKEITFSYRVLSEILENLENDGIIIKDDKEKYL